MKGIKNYRKSLHHNYELTIGHVIGSSTYPGLWIQSFSKYT